MNKIASNVPGTSAHHEPRTRGVHRTKNGSYVHRMSDVSVWPRSDDPLFPILLDTHHPGEVGFAAITRQIRTAAAKRPTHPIIRATSVVEDHPNLPASRAATRIMASIRAVWAPIISLSQPSTFPAILPRSFINSGSLRHPHTIKAIEKVKKEIKKAHPSSQSNRPAGKKITTENKIIPEKIRPKRRTADCLEEDLFGFIYSSNPRETRTAFILSAIIWIALAAWGRNLLIDIKPWITPG